MSTNSDENDENGSGKYARYAAMPSSMLVSSPPPSQDGSRPTAQMKPSKTFNDNKNDTVGKHDLESLRKWMDVAYNTNDYEAVIVISRLLIQHRDDQSGSSSSSSSSANSSDSHNPTNNKGTAMPAGLWDKEDDNFSATSIGDHSGAAMPSGLMQQEPKDEQPKFSALPTGLLNEVEVNDNFSSGEYASMPVASKQAALPADLWEEADLSDEASMPSALAGIDNNSGASMPAALVGRPGAEPVVSDIPMHIVQRNRMAVTVKNLQGRTILCKELNIGYTTVAMLKNMLHEEEGYFPVDQQRLVFAGKHLENHVYLSEYGVQPYSVIYSVEKVEGGGAMPSKLLAERDDRTEYVLTNDDFGRMALPSVPQSEAQHPSQNEEKTMVNVILSSNDIISGRHRVQINSNTATIETIQSEIYHNIGIPPYVQQLVLKGVGLQIPTDNASQTLASEFGIRDGSTVICSMDRNHSSFSSGSSRLEFIVKTLTGKVSHVVINSPDATTVRAVKEILYKKEGIPADEQRLIFAGKQLEDDKYLTEYGVPPWSTFHMVLRLRMGKASKELQEKLNMASSANDKDLKNNHGYFTNDNKGKTLAMFGLQSTEQLQEMKSLTVNFKRNAKGPGTNVMKKVVKGHIRGSSEVVIKNYPDINLAISAEEYLSDILDNVDDLFGRDDDTSDVTNVSDNVQESNLLLIWMIGSGNVNISETTKFSSGSITAREKSFNSIDAFWRKTKKEVTTSLSMHKDIGARPSPPPSVGMPMPASTYVVPTVQPPPMPMPVPISLDQPLPQAPMPMPAAVMPLGSPIPAAPIPRPHDDYQEPDGAAMPEGINLNCCSCVSLVCLAKLIPRWDLQSAKDQHRNRRITDEKERETAWSDYIENHPDIGVITLAYMHSGSSHKFLPFFVRFLLVSLVVVQLIIPMLVAYNEASQYYSNEEGSPMYCPSTADALNRTLAVTIGIIYLAKLTFIGLQKFSDSDNSPVLDESEYGGTIQLAIAADRWMHLVYEPGIYMLNLWIVYITPEPLDMVLNALAMEFILQLDDELKPLYLAVFEPDIDSYKEENNENGTKRIGSRQYVVVVLSSLLSLWSMIFLCVGIYASTIYLPICKPGES